MEYFKRLLDLLQIEKEEDRKSYKQLSENMPANERRANGITWYPVAIKGSEIGRGDYLTLEVERTTHHEIIHQLRFGMSAALFSNHDSKNDRLEGTISHISANKLKISFRTDEMPDWTRNGKLGIDAVYDKNSYDEMENALKLASALAAKKDAGHLIKILIGEKKPTSNSGTVPVFSSLLNVTQQEAIAKILKRMNLPLCTALRALVKLPRLYKPLKQ
jgi:hypothetical protein